MLSSSVLPLSEAQSENSRLPDGKIPDLEQFKKRYSDFSPKINSRVLDVLTADNPSEMAEKLKMAFQQEKLTVYLYEKNIQLNAQGWAIASIEDLPSNNVGELEIRASLPDHPSVPDARYFIQFEKDLPFARNYFADLHVHSDDTVGTNDTIYNLMWSQQTH